MYLPQKNITFKQYVLELMKDPERRHELDELIKVYGLQRLEKLVATGSMKLEQSDDKE